jgi:hypothetical protein
MWVLWLIFGVPIGIIVIACVIVYIKISMEKPREEDLGSLPKYRNSMLGSNSKSKNDREV